LKDQWHKGNLDLSKIGRSYFASVADSKGLKSNASQSLRSETLVRQAAKNLDYRRRSKPPRTGFALDEIRPAEKFLGEYIASKHVVKDSATPFIADVLAAYARSIYPKR